jgi:hypothetical protein
MINRFVLSPSFFSNYLLIFYGSDFLQEFMKNILPWELYFCILCCKLMRVALFWVDKTRISF